MASTVDVIVPCYQYGRFLETCVRSILTQEGVRVRALIIDDASEDSTPEVGRKLAAQDSRVIFRRHDRNRGHIATYNEGIDWADAQYLLLLSADDALAPGALTRAADVLNRLSDVVLTYGRAPVFSTADELAALTNSVAQCNSEWSISCGMDYLTQVIDAASNRTPTATAIVRTRAQKKIGGYRADLPHSGDMEMWLRFAAVGAVAFRDAPQAFRRMHGKNMELAYFGQELGDLAERKAAFDAFFAGIGAGIANAVDLRQRADRAVAETAFWRAAEAFDRGDTACMKKLLAFARDVYPPLVTSPKALRLAAKRLIGTKAWSRLAPLVERMRRPLIS